MKMSELPKIGTKLRVTEDNIVGTCEKAGAILTVVGHFENGTGFYATRSSKCTKVPPWCFRAAYIGSGLEVVEEEQFSDPLETFADNSNKDLWINYGRDTDSLALAIGECSTVREAEMVVKRLNEGKPALFAFGTELRARMGISNDSETVHTFFTNQEALDAAEALNTLFDRWPVPEDNVRVQ